VVDGTYTNTYKVSTTLEVTAVTWDLSTALTARASAALVDANAGSYYWDGTTLWVRPPLGLSIFSATVQATVAFYWANHPKILNNRWYDPRLKSAPGLSQRIETRFDTPSQTGGGNISLANNDGAFNALQDLQWDAGTISLRVGADVNDSEMAYSDYEVLATWRAEEWTRTVSDFQLRVVEPKAKASNKLPLSTYDVATYPSLDQQWIGKPIPIAYGKIYGAEPAPVDPGAKRFKLAGHAVKDITEVRIEQTTEETRSTTVAAASWQFYSGAVYRYYLPGESAKNVTFNTVSMTGKSSVDDVIATAGTWVQSDSYVYVNPNSGQTISSGTYVVQSTKGITAYQRVNPASRDLANGEFTLGSEWLPGTAVSVDFSGKTNASGELMNNAVDIVQDILALAGATNLDTSAFSTARARLKLGTGESNEELHALAIGYYLNDSKEALEHIAEILKAVGGYIYSSATGQYTVGVFQPGQGESMSSFTFKDLLDIEEQTDAGEMFSKLQVTFAPRNADNWVEVQNRESTAAQYLRQNSQADLEKREVITPAERDAVYSADRMLCQEAFPEKIWKLKVPWIGLKLRPGDQVHLRDTSPAIDEVLEISEVRIDLTAKTVSLTLGDLRCLSDTPGHWVADSDVLPTRFASLAGYSAGSLVWNKNWDAEIKAWARQNVGYWTDANGFADSTDPDSFLTSTWI
jgi:hypothetical protein